MNMWQINTYSLNFLPFALIPSIKQKEVAEIKTVEIEEREAGRKKWALKYIFRREFSRK